VRVPAEVAEHYEPIAPNHSGHKKSKALPKPRGVDEELKHARKFENLSLDDLASKIGVSKASLSQVENGNIGQENNPRTRTTMNKVRSWLSERQQ